MNVLVLNRGEIAFRAIKVCQKLELTSYCFVSENELETKITQQADHFISVSEQDNPYVNLDFINHVLKKYKIEVLYPGYGFLSEDPRLAKLCEENGVVFVGPSTLSLEKLASKKESQIFAKKCSLGVLEVQRPQAKDFPLMLKASFGGGGRGNKVVEDISKLINAESELKKKSQQLFDNSEIIYERYLPFAKHVELQFFATRDDVIFLGTRDCSLQLNYQKVLEEGPAQENANIKIKALYPKIKTTLMNYGYLGAGTIEFLWDKEKKELYFLEVNTRIQVEHTVTEMLYEIDLVQWQFELALNQFQLKDVKSRGHSFSARIYAVNPFMDFSPCPGEICYMKNNDDYRFDSFLNENGIVAHQYDPLIGKLVVVGKNRQDALYNLCRGLKELTIFGIHTNKGFLLELAKHDVFIAQEHNVSWLEGQKYELIKPIIDDEEIMSYLWDKKERGEDFFDMSLVEIHHHKYKVLARSQNFYVERIADGAILNFCVARQFWRESFLEKNNDYTSPITGKVIKVLVAEGEQVEQGDLLFVLEAMKTTVEIKAKKSAKVLSVLFQENDLVKTGAELLILN